MTAEEARTKALSILRDGRLRLLTVKTEPNGHLIFADAVVYGHRGEHFVTFHGATEKVEHGLTVRTHPHWLCSCREPDPPCAHVFSAEMVCHGILPPGRDGAPKARPVRKHAGVSA